MVLTLSFSCFFLLFILNVNQIVIVYNQKQYSEGNNENYKTSDTFRIQIDLRRNLFYDKKYSPEIRFLKSALKIEHAKCIIFVTVASDTFIIIMQDSI